MASREANVWRKVRQVTPTSFEVTSAGDTRGHRNLSAPSASRDVHSAIEVLHRPSHASVKNWVHVWLFYRTYQHLDAERKTILALTSANISSAGM